ncbi:MAG: hypothetical protein J5I65_13375 [Aridibacter famidurans]|nr:hypothetical protein [Aridibacter famidurans]
MAINYETAIPVEDTEELRKEADEIWNVFRGEVEREGYVAAMLRPANSTTDSEGTVTRRNFGFVFVKKKDGEWVNTADIKEHLDYERDLAKPTFSDR